MKRRETMQTKKYKELLSPIILLSILYFVAGKLSLLFLHGHSIINLGIFTSEGVSLAFILFYGLRVWPGIFIGQFFLAWSTDISAFVSFCIALSNSIEAFIAYMLFKESKLNIQLKTFKDIFGLIFIILTVQVIGSLSANSILVLTGVTPAQDFLHSSFSWWFGNVMGQLLITPFLLLFLLKMDDINIKNFLLYTLVYAFYIYFLEVILNITNLLLLLSFSIPIIVFVVSHKGFVYGLGMSAAVAFSTSYCVYLGIGAFSHGNIIDNTINYNLFVLAHLSTVLITGILFEERKLYLQHLQSTISSEISKNKEQQILLLQQSRLAQMGEMIAMIAHQWRQPLNNLSLSNQLLISKYTKGKLNDSVIENFKSNSKKQISYMSKTIDDFRNFFKADTLIQKILVNEVIHDILNITQDIYATYGIKLNFVENKQLYTLGSASELGQAILNIINNAKDALIDKEQENKFITIQLLQKKESIQILIEDNAGGIPQEIADKIFDPYFSTKKSKNGTGLGLYMTKMIIIEKLNGDIHFANTTQGVIFKITLKEISDAS
jgi:signal transduction histidine kinase